MSVSTRCVSTTTLENLRYRVNIVKIGMTESVKDVTLCVDYDDASSESVSLPVKDMPLFFEIVGALKEQLKI